MTQPMPTPGTVGITQLVIEDLLAREAKGIETYGTTLQAHNGRDAQQDLYEELLDACQYLRQVIEEDKKRYDVTFVGRITGHEHVHRGLTYVDALERANELLAGGYPVEMQEQS